ncbi:transcription initiation factor TFIID subunit 10 [Caerostris darwini]|uniref:Transcription initiation factor TFIID subunit 10 n=1 Tax=Caerostris darwini TaxID=1538125 RepID=A0AAV4VM34_9ARAC|nr:transcription initiation factor TFIID subunit 10 [Caerostris darwini]
MNISLLHLVTCKAEANIDTLKLQEFPSPLIKAEMMDDQESTTSSSSDRMSTYCQPSTSSAYRSVGESLSEFVVHLDEYKPTIPDPVVSFFLNSAGFSAEDPRVHKLISIAAQKFVADIANDALQHCKMRGAGQTKKSGKDKRYVLTMEDLSPTLGEFGINVKKPHYFA